MNEKNQLIDKALQTVEKYQMLHQGDRVLIGLSGGADSVCLFDMLHRLKKRYRLHLTAVHVNHGIRGKEALRDEKFVQQLCRRFDAPCEVLQRQVPEEAMQKKMSLEEAAREARYEVFETCLKEFGADKIAVAHNQNDQAETILMRILRGSGLEGISGIPPVRGAVIRPLIECSREDIEDYCRMRSLTYVNDSSNNEKNYLRNRIRLELLPYIRREINASVDLALVRLGDISREERQWTLFMVEQAYQKCQPEHDHKLEAFGRESVYLEIESLSEYPQALQNLVIRQGLQHVTNGLRDYKRKHIIEIRSLMHKSSGKKINLPGGVIAEKSYQYLCLHLYKREEEGFSYALFLDQPIYIEQLNMTVILSKSPLLDFGGSKGVFLEKLIQETLHIRSRAPGDRIYCEKIGGHKKIKDYLNEKKYPRFMRNQIALLATGDEVVYIMDSSGMTSDHFRAEPGKQRVYLNMLKGADGKDRRCSYES